MAVVQELQTLQRLVAHVLANVLGVLGVGHLDDVGHAAVHEVDDDPIAAFVVKHVAATKNTVSLIQLHKAYLINDLVLLLLT